MPGWAMSNRDVPGSSEHTAGGGRPPIERLTHEFRTRLTLVLAPLRDLEDGVCGSLGPEAQRQIELARSNARRALDIVEQLLDAARLEKGTLELKACRHDLATFLRCLCQRFQPLAERRRLVLRCRVPATAVPLWFDPEQLDKVFANLLANALKFTPAGGEVALILEQRESARMLGARRPAIPVLLIDGASDPTGTPPELTAQLSRPFDRRLLLQRVEGVLAAAEGGRREGVRLNGRSSLP